jgi:hypothetical protein
MWNIQRVDQEGDGVWTVKKKKKKKKKRLKNKFKSHLALFSDGYIS